MVASEEASGGDGAGAEGREAHHVAAGDRKSGPARPSGSPSGTRPGNAGPTSHRTADVSDLGQRLAVDFRPGLRWLGRHVLRRGRPRQPQCPSRGDGGGDQHP